MTLQKKNLFENLPHKADSISRRNPHTKGTVSRFCRYAAFGSPEVTSCGTFSGLDFWMEQCSLESSTSDPSRTKSFTRAGNARNF